MKVEDTIRDAMHVITKIVERQADAGRIGMETASAIYDELDVIEEQVAELA